MDKRISHLPLLIFFIFHNSIYGQIKNQYDIHLKYIKSEIKSGFEPTYTDNIYNAEIPTILGNLENEFNFELGLLSSNRSFLIQPGIAYSYIKYTGNQNLQKRYNDFQLKSHAIGLQCKFNLFKYGQRIVNPYFQINTNLLFSNINIDQSKFNIDITPENTDVEYNIDLISDSVKKAFISTSYGFSFGTEIMLRDRAYFITEIGSSMKSYPDFSVQSPFLLFELTYSLGIRYKILKNKKYLSE